MVFALGGGLKRAGRRHNLRPRHARQSRKDHAASSSRPLCPPPFFYISARATARVHLRNRWRLGRSPCPSPHAVAICRSGVGRNPSIANHSIFGCRGAVSHPAFGRRFAPTPNARAFPSPWLHGGMRQSARRNSNDGLIDPRMFRPSPPAFRSGGAEKSDSAQTLANPRPHLNQPLLLGAPAPIKNQTHLDFSCDFACRQKEHEQSEIWIYDRRAPQFLTGSCKAARGIRLLGRPAFFVAPRKAPKRHRRFYGEVLPENVEGGD